jgi:hypothetical protein
MRAPHLGKNFVRFHEVLETALHMAYQPPCASEANVLRSFSEGKMEEPKKSFIICCRSLDIPLKDGKYEIPFYLRYNGTFEQYYPERGPRDLARLYQELRRFSSEDEAKAFIDKCQTTRDSSATDFQIKPDSIDVVKSFRYLPGDDKTNHKGPSASRC